MGKAKLEKEEQEILDAFESGEFESVMTPAIKNAIQKSADETLKKDKRINIRVSGRYLAALQRRAAKDGAPYQTLVSSVLHKYVSGNLQDKIANK